MKLLNVIMAGGLLLGTLAPVASAHCGACGVGDKKDHHDKQGHRMEKRLDKMTEKLGLSTNQKSQIESIMKDHHEKIKALKEEKHQKIQAVLTDKQQKKYKKMKKEKYKKSGEKHHDCAEVKCKHKH